jgi:hypothetical protein
MRFQDVPQRGKRGKIIASRNRFGEYWKEYVPTKQPGTRSQRENWGNMADLSRLWNEISDERREAWHRLAQVVHSRPTLAQYGLLDGILLFKKINRVLWTCGREVRLDPPPLPVFGPNPVIGFAIRETRGGMAFRLKVSPQVRWPDRPPLEDLMLYAWAPCNAGVAKNSKYVFLGLLPAPTKGEIDITKLYLAKLKEWRKLRDRCYHIPLEGSRVFIRVWQQVNGWENELGMFRANGPAPARKWLR